MNFDEKMRNALVTFTIESLELLQDMEEHLLNLEDDEEPAERINAIFRAAHTIKGSSGVFGLNHIVAFTHVVESLLDSLRDGKLAVSSELVAALLPCCDHMALLIRAVVDGQLEENPESTAEGLKLLADLDNFTHAMPALSAQSAEKSVTKFTCPQEKIESMGRGEPSSGNWHLSLRFGPDSFRDGMDPLSFVRYLRTLGDIVNLVTICKGIPGPDEMDPETCYIGFEIELESSASKAEIEEVFEFVRMGSSIRILPFPSHVDDFIGLINDLPEDDVFLGEILVNSGAVTRHELDDALARQERKREIAADDGQQNAVPPIGEILPGQRLRLQHHQHCLNPWLDRTIKPYKRAFSNH